MTNKINSKTNKMKERNYKKIESVKKIVGD